MTQAKCAQSIQIVNGQGELFWQASLGVQSVIFTLLICEGSCSSIDFGEVLNDLGLGQARLDFFQCPGHVEVAVAVRSPCTKEM